MSWDYAELSHIAKEFGGPERFVNAVNYDGIVQGRWQVIIPELIFVAIACIGIGAKCNYDNHKSKKSSVSEVLPEQAKSNNPEEAIAVTASIDEQPTSEETAKAEKIVDRIRKRFKR